MLDWNGSIEGGSLKQGKLETMQYVLQLKCMIYNRLPILVIPQVCSVTNAREEAGGKKQIYHFRFKIIH